MELMYRQFDKDWDWYNEEIMRALIRIGTPAVTAFVRDKYAGSPWHARLFSQDVFETVHHDGSVDDALRVVPHEDDEFLRGQLGVALASHFDERGIEPRGLLLEDGTFGVVASEQRGGDEHARRSPRAHRLPQVSPMQSTPLQH